MVTGPYVSRYCKESSIGLRDVGGIGDEMEGAGSESSPNGLTLSPRVTRSITATQT